MNNVKLASILLSISYLLPLSKFHLLIFLKEKDLMFFNHYKIGKNKILDFKISFKF